MVSNEEVLIDNIRVKNIEISIESNPERKRELVKQLNKLKLQKEIEVIKKKIEQIG
ncbi:hypothetical protein SAMN05444372_101148 [Flavobacterium micromati]|uniref:Uncharacterized protein n=1 Tax=Flavobacterium micromati TaxID=229205 RepID=A0A1M5FIJ2_9FLAO|nr:hypothetical protein SAMN05444372_101148 [Flavobacterium micromati]